MTGTGQRFLPCRIYFRDAEMGCTLIGRISGSVMGLNPEQCRRVEQLHERLGATPANEHGALLDQLCADDSQVRAEVMTMLRRASSTATPPAPDEQRAPQPDSLIG